MVKHLGITIANSVHAFIEKNKKPNNRSEFCEELFRLGIKTLEQQHNAFFLAIRPTTTPLEKKSFGAKHKKKRQDTSTVPASIKKTKTGGMIKHG